MAPCRGIDGRNIAGLPPTAPADRLKSICSPERLTLASAQKPEPWRAIYRETFASLPFFAGRRLFRDRAAA